MYNSVKLETEDCFMQCFLWRNLDESKEPDTYMVMVNNIGIKPAGAIATLALQKSSDLHQENYPVASYQLKDGSYVDDVGITGKRKEEV